ncbi:MAG: DUF499 domain-containing protein, partial [Moorella sp. (in: Bacteria)]|nr:DUF499 domain-containing protein [Moorella sp. (in: firmicutes)]
SMKLLLQDVSARLAGAPGANPVFRLETGFGGGKAHNIIAAVHVARKGAGLADFLTEYGVERLPAPGLVGVAAFVGDQADPVSGIRHGTGEQTIRTYTPWGEIAYQLGGVEGYRLIQENDVQGIAPSRQALADICGERPALIVLDELVLYFARVLALREDHPRRNVVRQMPIFLQTLFTFAAKDRSNAAVIFTLPSEQDANRYVTAELKQVIPQLLEAVGEMEDISNRQARNLTPTLGWAEIKEELDAWIASVYSGFEHFEVIFFPESHLDIPDTADRLGLVIIHYDKECGYVGHGERLSFTASLLARTGVSGSPRVYRNNIVFARPGRVRGCPEGSCAGRPGLARVKEDLLNEQRQITEAAGQDLRIWKEAARRGAGGVPPEFLALERDLEKTELHRGKAELGVRSGLLEAYRVLACPPVPGRDDDLFFSLRPPLECYRVDFGESALRRAAA